MPKSYPSPPSPARRRCHKSIVPCPLLPVCILSSCPFLTHKICKCAAPAALAASLNLRDSTASIAADIHSKVKTPLQIPNSSFHCAHPKNNITSINHFRCKASTFVSHIKSNRLHLPKQPTNMLLLRYLQLEFALPAMVIYRSSHQSCSYFGTYSIYLTYRRSSHLT